MPFKNIHFIINPASGNKRPIFSIINEVMGHAVFELEITVTREENDAFETAKKLIGKTDLVVVYGGDGSVSQVAKALMGTDTPMAIIPGGTANVLSKELHIPQDTQKALELILDGNAKIKRMDMGEANGCPFLLRINFGIMADMVLDTGHDLKNKLGQLAYSVTTVKTIATATPEKYQLIIDGKLIEDEGVSLTVTNAGNIGIGDFSLLPGISVEDGYLDVILLKDADLLSVLKVAGTTLFQTESEILKHWRCKTITIGTSGPVAYICDDKEEKADKVDIKIKPMSLNVLTPNA